MAPKAKGGATLGFDGSLIETLDCGGPTKLCIYSTFGEDRLLEEGIPPRLASSLDASTWVMLTSKVREYQFEFLRQGAKITCCVILPLIFLLIAAAFFLDIEDNDLIFWSYYSCMAAIFFGTELLKFYCRERCAKVVFHPAVQTVLEELEPKLTETGYRVELVIEPGHLCCVPSQSYYLLFTALNENNKISQEARL